MIIGESEGLTQYLRRINAYPTLDKSQEKTATPEQLVLSNLRLVVYFAKRWARTADDLLERIQDGNIGLLIVSTKFDPTKEVRFATYAAWYINDAIRQAVLDRTRTVRTPRHILKMYKSTMNLIDDGKTVSETAEILGVKDYVVSSIRDYQMLSMDQTPELVDGEYEINVDSIHVELKMKRCLNNIELYVIQTRLEGYSQEEIGEHLGVSNSRVQQIEARATHKLRSGYNKPTV